jgi:hypothetical protein
MVRLEFRSQLAVQIMRRPSVHLSGQVREHLGRLLVNILSSIRSVTPGRRNGRRRTPLRLPR